MNQYVVGYGDNVVDYYRNQNIKYPGGNAVNFSVNALKNNVTSYYVGSIANDNDGDLLYNSLNAVGVGLEHVERFDSTLPTENTKVDIVDGDRVFVSATRGDRRTPKLTSSLISFLSNARLVHSSCHSNVEEYLPLLAQNGTRISYDFDSGPKYHTDDYLKQVCPSLYIAQFSVSDQPDTEVQRLIDRCATLGVAYALFTRGSEAPFFIDLSSKQRFDGFNRLVKNPLDTMGAGDSYFAAFASTFVTTDSSLTLETRVTESFNRAAESSSRTIMEAGSYGFGIPINNQ